MGYLRFTLDEYNAVARAAGPLPVSGSYADFRRALSGALRRAHPALAERVAGLSLKLVRVLREYLEARRASRSRRSDKEAEGQGQAGSGLSLCEWMAVSRACELVWLHNDALPPVKGYLVQQVAEASPTLAEKLERLSNAQFARLCLALKSGRRCCP